MFSLTLCPTLSLFRLLTTNILTYLNLVGLLYFFWVLKLWIVDAITITVLCFWLPLPRFFFSSFSSFSVSTLSKKPSSNSTILSNWYLLSLYPMVILIFCIIYHIGS